jgi:hypothetical protein
VQQDGRQGRAVDRERLDDFDLAFEAERLAEGAFRLLDRFGLVFALATGRLAADFALPEGFLVDFVAATFALTPPATRSPRLAAASTAAPARCAAAATALASSSARSFSASAAACAAPNAANAASLTGSFILASLCPTKV